MPRISAFYGIVITMYFADQPPPHFHARYGEFQAQIEIASGGVILGTLPARATNLVREWCLIHQSELEADWALAAAEQPLASIEPLP